jgi:transcriptional regulator with GAF, ATPase, and Fis domain
MQEVFVKIRRIASHFRTALVTGPTGSGKELVARALHRQSPAARGPLVVCNCSAIAETLLESELFGHVRGAFTGATQDRIGMVEYANGGTLFLDEIGEMPLAMQAKLLRVLQNQEIQRVGSPAVRKVDVRIVAATHRDLGEMVAKGQFREDLYYRLSMVEIKLPRLADHKEDLPLLERHFLERFAKDYIKPIGGFLIRT